MKKIYKGLVVGCSLMAICFSGFLGVNTEAAVQNDTYSARYYIKGDMDFNGKIEIKDAQIALKASEGLIVLTDLETKVGDMNNNGVVDREDAEIILKMALNLI